MEDFVLLLCGKIPESKTSVNKNQCLFASQTTLVQEVQAGQCLYCTFTIMDHDSPEPWYLQRYLWPVAPASWSTPGLHGKSPIRPCTPSLQVSCMQGRVSKAPGEDTMKNALLIPSLVTFWDLWPQTAIYTPVKGLIEFTHSPKHTCQM